MKFAGAAARRAAESDRVPRAVLISGPDRGMVRRLGDRIAGRLQAAESGLETTRYSEDDLKADAGRLEAAVSGGSLFGGAALARVRIAGEGQSGVLLSLLAAAQGGLAGALIIEAEDLGRSSKLRKAFEESPGGWSLQLYAATGEELAGVARATAGELGVRLEADAQAAILESVAQDTDSVAAEVEKLALYAGPGGVIDLEAVAVLGSGGREAAVEDAVHAAFSGRRDEALARLAQAFGSGAHPVQALNAFIRRVRLLMALRAEVEAGRAAADLVKDRRFNIFWMRQADVARQAGAWLRPELDDALARCVAADAACKRGGAPDQALVERLALRLATRARR